PSPSAPPSSSSGSAPGYQSASLPFGNLQGSAHRMPGETAIARSRSDSHTAMKTNTIRIPLLLAICLASCDKKSDAPAPPRVQVADYSESDVPILPVKAGDVWKYRVTVEIPEGITSEGAASIETET